MKRRLIVGQRTDMPYGGHFGEWEAPELLADDIGRFFAALR